MFFSFHPLCQAQTDTLSMQFRRLDAKDGLSQGLIKGIVQDPEGFMWFATGDGLNRYDGYQMKVYRHNTADPNSIPENSVTGLALDKNGNFWIATATKGLWRMDRRTERFSCFLKSEIAGGTLTYMMFEDGWLLAGGREKDELLDVRKVNPTTKSCVRFSTKPGLVAEHFILLPGGVLMSRNILSGVITEWVRNGKELKKGTVVFQEKHPSQFNHSNWMYDEANNALWVIHDTKLFRLKSGWDKKEYISELPGQMRNKLVAMFKWTDRKILLQVFPEGAIWMLDKQTGNVSRIHSNHPSRGPITEIYTDSAGNKWIGTGGEGLSILLKGSQKFQTWTRDQFVYHITTSPKQEVVFYDQVETIWIDPHNRTRRALKFPPGKVMESLSPIVYSPSGTGWVPFTIDQKSTLLVPDKPGIKPIKLPPLKDKSWSGEPVLFIDSVQNLWRVESGGNNQRHLRRTNLDHPDDDAAWLFPASSLLHSMPFVSGYQIIGHCLWLGTTQGLFCFNMKTEKWEKHHQNQKGNQGSLSNDVVLSLCPDPKEPSRFLWVGTHGGGICKVELPTGISINYSMKDGLPNDVVYGILSDEFHNLWLSTNKGLSCFTPPKTKRDKPLFRNFTTEDGLANDEFNRYGYTKMADGTLVFGGTHGLTWFSPKEVLNTGKPPQIGITGFSIFNTPVDFRTDSLVVNKPFPFARQINLNHEQDMFRIEFASMDFGPSSKKQYSYFLEGYDKKWIPGGTTNSATYTNLSPGEYIFRVKGTNADGIWSTEEAKIVICISPPWWATWWFRSLMGISVCGLVYGVYRYQLSQAIKVVKLRNRIALDLHDEIGSTLNSIAFFGEVANQLMEDNDKARPVLSRMSTHAKEVVESMSDIVWSLNSKNDSFVHLVDRLQSFATNLLEPKGCQIDFHRPANIQDIKPETEQRRNLYLILKEAINNSAKYAEASRFWVHFDIRGNELSIEVGDNGKGFDMAKDPTGNGLESMQARAKNMGAKWKLESRPMKGTRLNLTVKI